MSGQIREKFDTPTIIYKHRDTRFTEDALSLGRARRPYARTRRDESVALPGAQHKEWERSHVSTTTWRADGVRTQANKSTGQFASFQSKHPDQDRISAGITTPM